MTNISLINSDILNFPFSRNGDDYYSSICRLFEQYLEIINGFNDEFGSKIKINLPIIENEIKLIKEALEFYLVGKTNHAYQKINECLELLKSKNLLEIGDINGDFYRIRTGSNINYSKKDLFHIPFQMREKVATQRYSIPGLPCIYMADSLYTAWEEMNRPDFNNIHVTRLSFNTKNTKLLFLNTTTQEIRNRCIVDDKITKENILIKYLSYWPLLASCSFVVYKREETFKPEYILPQMVLQWVIENDNIDGIQFKSNRIKYDVSNIGSFNNVAIPVVKNKEKGYCEILSNKIEFTEPLSWSLLDISEPNIKNFLNKEDIKVDDIRSASYIELINGEKSDYFTTKFGIMETKLKSMPIKKLTNA
ncbi:hypothetical protein [Flavobacterium sp.]|uniref:hypothetical protein n=1 Tax=Flavobacterium sp. TaxID=239 RepID=UPI002FDE65D0